MNGPLTDKGPHGSQGVFCDPADIVQMGKDLDSRADAGEDAKARALLLQWAAELHGQQPVDMLWAAAQLVGNILTMATRDRQQQRQLLRSFLSMVVVADAAFQGGAVNWLGVLPNKGKH